MKAKIQTSFPRRTLEVNNVYFGSDLHLNHEAVIKFGRQFNDVTEMNSSIIAGINKKVGKDDMLVLLGDSMMIDKNYAQLLTDLNCENIILLYGNHCSHGKCLEVFESKQFDKLLYVGYYLELSIDKQWICCSHYPMFNWNYMDDGAFSLHGHLHADENEVLKEIHKYKSMDVGVDNYKKLYGQYEVFSFQEIREQLEDKLIMGRH